MLLMYKYTSTLYQIDVILILLIPNPNHNLPFLNKALSLSPFHPRLRGIFAVGMQRRLPNAARLCIAINIHPTIPLPCQFQTLMKEYRP